MVKKLTLFLLLLSGTIYAQKSFFEWRTYELQWGHNAQPLHDYLSGALIPALNDNGVETIGAFEHMENHLPKKIYLLITYKSMAHYAQVRKALKKEAKFLKAKQKYDAVSQEEAPYDRYTTSFYEGFDNYQHLVLPKKGDVLFELRTYESYSEDAAHRKIKMFNEYEFDIFKGAGLHSVFFGEQVAGPNMPSLTYITSHSSMEARNKSWDAFRVHPEWKRVSQLEECDNTVSNIALDFLVQLPYSQL